MNRSILLLIFLFASVVSVVAQAPTASAKGPILTWESNLFDFGDITQGDKVEHTFKFVNTGTEPLIITNVEVTCGCTTPKGWPRDPIGPGEKGEIVIAFSSAGKYGKQNKAVTVISNAVNPNRGQLTFSANVLEKKINN